ncbi:MAG: AAA family ATPase, partial [Flavobacterium sp.]
MKIFKISHGTSFIDIENFNLLKKKKLVTMGCETLAKGQSKETQFQKFTNAEKGDLFYVCRSNESIELIGMFIDKRHMFSSIKSHEDAWIDREYITLAYAKEPTEYNKNLGKWWAPSDNSTFIEIPNYEYNLFENEILKPVFDKELSEIINLRLNSLDKISKNMEFYQELQKNFTELFDNEMLLFAKINDLDDLELRKLFYEYNEKRNIANQPVVLLRSKILEKLLNKEIINSDTIATIKSELTAKFEKNVYKAWTSNFRILYTLIFSKYKPSLEEFFYNLIESIQKDLDLVNHTHKTLIHFDGPQNQGFTRIWFAIYNKTFKSQKYAKQLFFEINDGLKYGLLQYGDHSATKLVASDDFNYENLIEIFKSHTKEILNDNSMEKAKISEYIDILENKKQIILQGPPGTGKTFTAKKIAEQLLGTLNPLQYRIIQFHPSYSYEDFVRGINTNVIQTQTGSQLVYETKNKVFAEIARLAYESKAQGNDKKFVLIIDEINRANLASVLGELIYGLEYRNKTINSMYDINNDFSIIIPDNLYLIGTMNTADRSVGHIDYAIRRRFAFIDILPNPDVIDYPNSKSLFY